MATSSWSVTFDAAADKQEPQVEAIRKTLQPLLDSDVLPEGNHTLGISRTDAESGVAQLVVTVTITPPIKEPETTDAASEDDNP